MTTEDTLDLQAQAIRYLYVIVNYLERRIEALEGELE